MDFKAGQIVKTDVSKTHKMIVSFDGRFAVLEWWDFGEGPKTEVVGVRHLIFIDEKATPEYSNAREVWTAARDKHHELQAAEKTRQRLDRQAKNRRPKKYKISTVPPGTRSW